MWKWSIAVAAKRAVAVRRESEVERRGREGRSVGVIAVVHCMIVRGGVFGVPFVFYTSYPSVW